MTVRKKGNKWYCRFQIDGVRYERRCPLAVDERTALQAEKIIATEIMRGNLNFAKAKILPKLKDLTTIYLDYSKTNKNSYQNDVNSVNVFLDYWGNCEANAITSADIESFKAHLKDTTTNKNSTINRHLQALSKMFNLGIANGLIEKNPMRQVKKLKEDNFKMRFLDKKEEKRLFEALNYHYTVTTRERTQKEFFPFKHLEELIICALQTGMRRGEIFGLLKSCVDIKNGYIELLKTKSGKARKIPISNKLKPILEKALNDKTNESEYVFVNPETRTKYNDIKHAFSNLLLKAKIKNFRFHDFRHTVATRMVEAGIDLAVVQEILGHANIQTTMRYAHPVPERKKQAIDALSSF